MKKLILILLLWFSKYGIAQTRDEQVPTKNIYLNNWKLASTYTLEVTQFVPLGNLRRSLGPTMGFGAYMGVPINDRTRIDLGTSVYVPNERYPVKYDTGSEQLEGGTLLSGTLGVWATRVKRIGRTLFWDNRVGAGLGFFQTDIETGKPKSENDSVYSAETVFLNFGTALRTSIFKQNIGLKVDYFLAPYNLFKQRLPSQFGMQYATIGLSYGF